MVRFFCALVSAMQAVILKAMVAMYTSRRNGQCYSPRFDARKRKPKTLPLSVVQYRSARIDSTHGMISARPNPFHALRHIACVFE